MAGWYVSEKEIQELENLLLPSGCHFADDAKEVIRCWETKDVAACPGSGKTTVLLAKLKLLADKMPLHNGAGVCVLSHTNVAVDEIKKRLSNYSDKLMGYPNYIGTIQSFIDRFVTMPYIRRKYGKTVQPVDDYVYAEHLCHAIYSGNYRELQYRIRNHYNANASRYADRTDYVKALFIDSNGNLKIQGQSKSLASNGTPSATQFSNAEKDVITSDSIIRYKDTYPLAREAIAELSEEYTNLFCLRFQYVYIDEYQDCNTDQRDALDRLFNSSMCNVMRIGDPDQAIYNFQTDNIVDWIPKDNHLVIESSCRYVQEIADILTPLRVGGNMIVSSVGNGGHKPILLVFDKNNPKSIANVLGQFVVQLEERGLTDPSGVYKAIGYVGKESVSGLRIGSYWDKFEAVEKARNDFRYWIIIDEICLALKSGKLYRAEQSLRKLICKVFHYAQITDEKTGKDFNTNSIKKWLKESKSDFSSLMLSFADIRDINRENTDTAFRKVMDSLLADKGLTSESVFKSLPNSFLNDAIEKNNNSKDNVFVDPIRGRKIWFETIHGVKGQTHDATLYLETERSNGSDLGRILYRYGIGKPSNSPLYDYSRKLAYVGFSRPKKLLCVAMQESTFNKCNNSIDKSKWEIVDIRHP